jgi:hypothetical protein
MPVRSQSRWYSLCIDHEVMQSYLSGILFMVSIKRSKLGVVTGKRPRYMF